jgi:hypothetical protein
MKFAAETPLGRESFLEEWRSAMGAFSKIVTAEFQVTSIRAVFVQSSPGRPASLETRVRFELVGMGTDFHREQRVGNWGLDWEMLLRVKFGSGSGECWTSSAAGLWPRSSWI